MSVPVTSLGPGQNQPLLFTPELFFLATILQSSKKYFDLDSGFEILHHSVNRGKKAGKCNVTVCRKYWHFEREILHTGKHQQLKMVWWNSGIEQSMF